MQSNQPPQRFTPSPTLVDAFLAVYNKNQHNKLSIWYAGKALARKGGVHLLTEAVEGALKTVFLQLCSQEPDCVRLSTKGLTTLKTAIHCRIPRVEPADKDALTADIFNQLVNDLEQGKTVAFGAGIVYKEQRVCMQAHASSNRPLTSGPVAELTTKQPDEGAATSDSEGTQT